MRCVALLALFVLAACQGKQSFDERYDEQSTHISTTANGIEKQVAEQLSGAAEADRAAREIKTQQAPAAGSTAP